MEDLGHSEIDVLKVDVEGSEFLFLEDALDSSAMGGVKQLTLEWHHYGKDKRYGGRGVSTVDVFGPGRRPGKNKGYGGRGVSTDDVFGGRRRGARDRARSFIK